MKRIAPGAFFHLCLAAGAAAQYEADFEALQASASGTPLSNQDGWQVPAGSVDFAVHTYAGNALGVPANPTGGAQFVAGSGPGGATFARAERALAYGNGDGTWTIGFDVCAVFTGTLPAAPNVGSVSLQPTATAQHFVALARWTDPATATTWSADYAWFTAGNVPVTSAVPHASFQGLATGRWYRWETDVDLTGNLIVEVRLVDLATSTVARHRPVGWYLAGGASRAATPHALRLFAGGGVPGATLALDNVAVRGAGFCTGFEALAASAAGTPVAGQDGWSTPAGSAALTAHTHAANSLGVPALAAGGSAFVGATAPSGSAIAAAQRNVSFACGAGRWTLAFDLCATFQGTLPAPPELGGVSLQPATARAFMARARWADPGTASGFDVHYTYWTAANVATTALVPDATFQGLAAAKWYRHEVDFDLTQNRILELRLVDLATSAVARHAPADWFLQGGAGAAAPPPSALQLTVGGAGNTLAFDHLCVFPAPSHVRVYGCGVNPAGSMRVLSGSAALGNTLTLGLDNPLGTQASGGATALLFAASPHPSFPCGTPLPGFGMGGPASNGELLLLPASYVGAVYGTTWNGFAPAPFVMRIPRTCSLVGGVAYAQGVVLDPQPNAAVPIGLTDAVELRMAQ